MEKLASGLHVAGVEIISTGSTVARIGAAGVPVTPVEQLTGFPECLDGQVKTLHPRVHAGLSRTPQNPVTGALWHCADVLRYGENPHQRAVPYARPGPGDGIETMCHLCLVTCSVLHTEDRPTVVEPASSTLISTGPAGSARPPSRPADLRIRSQPTGIRVPDPILPCRVTSPSRALS